MLGFVVLNCVVIAADRPSFDDEGIERWYIDTAHFFLTGIFIVEAAVKIVSDGLVFGPGSYLKNIWNWIDFLLIITSIIDFSLDLANTDGDDILRAFRIVRFLRTFRPLRMVTHMPGLKTVTGMLIVSFRSIVHVLLVCSIFFFVFAVLGLQIFRGCFYRCVIPSESHNNNINNQLDRAIMSANHTNGSSLFDKKSYTELQSMLEDVKTKQDCLDIDGLEWHNPVYNFDNIIQSFMSLLVIVTIDGWIEITQNGLDCVDVDKQVLFFPVSYFV